METKLSQRSLDKSRGIGISIGSSGTGKERINTNLSNAGLDQRSAYIQALALIKRYITYKKRHWFSTILFDAALPIFIMLLVLFATITSHWEWMNKCLQQSTVTKNIDNSSIIESTTSIYNLSQLSTQTNISFPLAQHDYTTVDYQEKILLTTNSYNITNDTSQGFQISRPPTIISDDGVKIFQHLLPRKQSTVKETIISFDLYNSAALGLVIWIYYLWHFCRTINFFIEDKVTGRRFLMHIHGLNKVSYYVAHYFILVVVILILSIAVVIGMSVIVAPDYSLVHVLTFICFSLQTTSLIFALSSFSQSYTNGSMISLLVWSAHLFFFFADDILSMDHYGNFSYAIQFFACMLPEQVVIYIYKNNRKLSTGWDSIPKVKDCQYHGVIPLQSKVFGIGIGNTTRKIVYAIPGIEPKYAMPDRYLLISMIAWSILFMLFACFFDDFSIIRPVDKHNLSYDCCTFRDNLKTLLWDPTKPSKIRDSFATLATGDGESVNGLMPRYFENVEINQERYLGIYVDQVCKQMSTASNIFGLSKRMKVVDEVSFNIYRGQVTLLLGHNGAGKTTMINMIVGKMKPTSGRVYVNGLDVVGHRYAVRSYMSLCPQDSIITDYLTVYEHLELMACIKQGVAINDEIYASVVNKDHMRQHIAAIASEIGLRDQLGKCAYQLSGGAKRKLSLAMSFVGDSSILVLDEPSSGLDPESRKMIWDAIKRRKTNRTLLISTQHMEEADYLGDRVAIMNRGKITCCGSAVFLKRVLGSGNKLRLALLPNANRSLALTLVHEFFPAAIDLSKDANKVLSENLKKEHLNDVLIELKTSQKTEVEDEDGLIRLFEKLETSHMQYGIKSFSLHGSTVEDVLLNSAKINNNLADQDSLTVNGGILSHDIINMKLFTLIRASGRDTNRNDPTITRAEGSCFSYTLALFVKNFLILTRSWYLVLPWRFVVPLIIFYFIFHTLRLVGQEYLVKSATEGVRVTNQDDDAPMAGYIYFESYGALTRVFGFFAFIHFVLVPTEERVSKFKLVLLNSRANVLNYWLSQYLTDLSFVVLYSAAVFIYLNLSNSLNLSMFTYGGQTTNIYGFDTITRFGIWAQIFAVVVTFLFCSSALFVCYLLSLVCSGPSSASISLLFVFATGYVVDFIANLSGLDVIMIKDRTRTEQVANILHYIIPSETYHLNLAFLLDVCLENDIHPVCSDEKIETRCYGKLAHILSSDGLLIPLVVQCIQLFGLFASLMLAEYYDLIPTLGHIYDSIFYFMRSRAHLARFTDEDIEREKNFAHSLCNILRKKRNNRIVGREWPNLENTGVVVHEAVKVYSTGTRAVDDISFTVGRNEIFGLLGVNGAGKTSLFGLLSGDIKPDSGYLYAFSLNVVTEASLCRRNCGYDPQVDPSFDLTLVEALYLMANLRGISNSNQATAAVQSCLDLLDLHPHSETLFHKLSTGTRRKLSLALAWLGSPPLLLLDEPTSGVDPIARRNIWASLTQMKIRAGESIVIASNAMEECEAICDRLAIISRGQIRCLGTVQNLSARFNQGYLLRLQFDSVKAPRNRMTAKQLIENVNNHLKAKIPSLIVDDTSVDSAVYKITDFKMPRSSILKILRQTRADFNGCISYMLSDATLDDVFLALAREQERGDKSLGSKSHTRNKEEAKPMTKNKIGHKFFQRTRRMSPK